jgi:carbon starvation protein
MLMGFHMFVFRKGHIREATIIGVVLLLGAVIFGRTFAESSYGHYLVLTRHQVTAAMAIYALAASILPMWMLLTPRGYLSTFMKIGTIAFLALGVIIVNPTLQAPAFSQFIHGGGPVIPGPLYPFVFITIACGAVSGFHSLIATGTTPKMVDKESDIRPIGYAGMLCEGFVGVMALIAATALHPGDYFAINTSASVFANLNIPIVNLPDLQAAVGESVTARPGGAVSLAVGMAQIFAALPGMKGLMAYWYHFAIMFEALFILTTVDSGTRVGRFLVQEFGGRCVEEAGRRRMAARFTRRHAHSWCWRGAISSGPATSTPSGRSSASPTAAWRRCARRRDDGPDQHGTNACRVGHVPSALLPVGNDDDRGLYEHQGQLLAACGAHEP